MQVHNAVFITTITNLELPVDSTFFFPPLKYTETAVYFPFQTPTKSVGLLWAGAFHVTRTQAFVGS